MWAGITESSLKKVRRAYGRRGWFGVAAGFPLANDLIRRAQEESATWELS